MTLHTTAPAAPGAPNSELIRLAQANEPGAALYNSYHFLTQLSGLYAQAAQYDPDKIAAVTWGELCDRAIGDLGELFHAWEAVLGEARAGKPVPIELKVSDAVVLACRRAQALMVLLNVWTPMSRWARIMARNERRWQRFLDRFTAASPVTKAALAGARTGSLDRLSRLTGLSERYRQEEARATAALAVAVGSGAV